VSLDSIVEQEWISAGTSTFVLRSIFPTRNEDDKETRIEMPRIAALVFEHFEVHTSKAISILSIFVGS
jgi:hypothetical protein